MNFPYKMLSFFPQLPSPMPHTPIIIKMRSRVVSAMTFGISCRGVCNLKKKKKFCKHSFFMILKKQKEHMLI